MDKLKIEILTFLQNDETLTVAWDRFKRLIRMCPSHGLSKGELVQAFYKGLEHASRSWLDWRRLRVQNTSSRISTSGRPKSH